MRSLLLLALAALVGCGQPPQLGGRQSHGPPVATAGNWTPSEAAVEAALAGFPNTPFSGGGSATNASTPVSGSSGAFGGGGITSDGGIYSQYGGFTGQGVPPTVAGGNGFAMGNVSSFGALCHATSSYSLSTCEVYVDGVNTFINAPSGPIAFRVGNSPRAAVDSTYGLTNAISIGTAGSGTGITVLVTGAERHYTHVITVARTALTAAAATQDVTLWTVPARTRVRAVIADGTAAFDDGAGGISALTITCGKSAGGNEYLLSGSLFTVNTLGDATGEVGASLTTYFGDVPSWSSTTAVQCRFTSTGGNLSTLTTGSATFYLEMESLP